MSLAAFDTKEVEIGGEIYSIKKMKALIGLRVQKKIYESGMISESGINVLALEPETIMEIVINGASKGSVSFDEKKFNVEFAARFNELYMLVAEILQFNFSDEKKDDSE
ncbi:hypothetical protein D3C78_1335420 [compost metagenome]